MSRKKRRVEVIDRSSWIDDSTWTRAVKFEGTEDVRNLYTMLVGHRPAVYMWDAFGRLPENEEFWNIPHHRWVEFKDELARILNFKWEVIKHGQDKNL